MKNFIAVVTAALTLMGAAEAASLKIGVLPAADAVVLYAAADEGLFRAEGLDVEIVPFKSALEIGAAMRAKRLDGHFGDLMNVLTQNERGISQAVVLTTTHTSPEQRAFGLVVSPKVADTIRSLADLKGTETAMSSATIIDYLLGRMKTEEKLPEGAMRALPPDSAPSHTPVPALPTRPTPRAGKSARDGAGRPTTRDAAARD